MNSKLENLQRSFWNYIRAKQWVEILHESIKHYSKVLWHRNPSWVIKYPKICFISIIIHFIKFCTAFAFEKKAKKYRAGEFSLFIHTK